MNNYAFTATMHEAVGAILRATDFTGYVYELAECDSGLYGPHANLPGGLDADIPYGGKLNSFRVEVGGGTIGVITLVINAYGWVLRAYYEAWMENAQHPVTIP